MEWAEHRAQGPAPERLPVPWEFCVAAETERHKPGGLKQWKFSFWFQRPEMKVSAVGGSFLPPAGFWWLRVLLRQRCPDLCLCSRGSVFSTCLPRLSQWRLLLGLGPTWTIQVQNLNRTCEDFQNKVTFTGSKGTHLSGGHHSPTRCPVWRVRPSSALALLLGGCRVCTPRSAQSGLLPA